MVIVSTANPYKFSDALLDAFDLPKDAYGWSGNFRGFVQLRQEL